MTRPPLRVATRAVISIEMGEAIEAAMRECMAAQPTAVLIAWEVAGDVVCRSIPDSTVLKRGMIDVLFEYQHPEPVGE